MCMSVMGKANVRNGWVDFDFDVVCVIVFFYCVCDDLRL